MDEQTSSKADDILSEATATKKITTRPGRQVHWLQHHKNTLDIKILFLHITRNKFLMI